MLPAAAEEEEIPADDTDAEAILRLRVDHDGLKLGFKGVLCLAPAWTEDACQQSNLVRWADRLPRHHQTKSEQNVAGERLRRTCCASESE